MQNCLFVIVTILKVAMVGEIGGTTLDDTTRRIMAFLMSHELALQYNLFGRHGKYKFRDLRLFDVVFGKYQFS